jgi:cysteine desulfurase/selenocysteine lyase
MMTWFEQNRAAHEQYLAAMTADLVAKLAAIPGIVILGGEKAARLNLVSFYHQAFSSQDIGLVLSQHGVDCRVGRHCSDLLYEHLGVKDSVRLSLAAYNDVAQIEKVVAILQQLPQFLYQTRL